MLSLLSMALAPAVVLITFVYFRDKYEREPLGLLIKCFLFGAFSIAPAIGLETLLMGLGLGEGPGLIQTAIFAFITVAFSEELSKYIFLRWYAYPKKDFNEPYDGIMYTMMIGMGFATVENVLYVLEGGMSTALVRMFTAVPAHATFAIIMGFYAGKAKFDKKNEAAYLLTGLLLAILFHGAYDFFLMQQYNVAIAAGALVSLIIGIRYSLRAMRLHQKDSPFKHNTTDGLPDK